VKLTVPLGDGLALEIADRASGADDYPTKRLQKGLLLLDRGRGLAEEGVGFGVPVIKRGIETIFPGGLRLSHERSGPLWEVTALFEMNLVERLARPGAESLRSRSLYVAKNSLAALHRRAPALRGPLTATSNALRRSFGWVTTFEETGSAVTLKLTYTIREGEGSVGAALDPSELSRNGVGEVVVMNEQGAHHFDRYVDADGTTLRGSAIGTWDEVAAGRASFVSSAHRVAFSLGQVEGARLHRGRELIGSRVAWSGFGYSFPPTLAGFRYDLGVERVP
jgi:hypothetical protein